MQAVTSHALGSSSMSRSAVATWLSSTLLQLAPYTMMCLKPHLSRPGRWPLAEGAARKGHGLQLGEQFWGFSLVVSVAPWARFRV